MGGPGSGRRLNTARFVESYARIDVRVWQREGFLEPNRRFSCHQTRGQMVADSTASDSSFNVEVRQSSDERHDLILVLNYTVWRPGLLRGQCDPIELRISLIFTPCHYGGRRPWFLCPMPGCGRRVAILHFRGLYFLCRHCHSLGYASQHMNSEERAQHRLRKICSRLRVPEAPPERPRRMRWTTYKWLIDQAAQAEWALLDPDLRQALEK